MELVIEAVGETEPLGLPLLSVAHYREQNDDLMRDPEMCFELIGSDNGVLSFDPFYWRNDYVGVEQWSRNIVASQYVQRAALYIQHLRFAATWDDNLRLQGFAGAFSDKCILG